MNNDDEVKRNLTVMAVQAYLDVTEEVMKLYPKLSVEMKNILEESVYAMLFSIKSSQHTKKLEELPSPKEFKEIRNTVNGMLNEIFEVVKEKRLREKEHLK